jgi:hypothetical protein
MEILLQGGRGQHICHPPDSDGLRLAIDRVLPVPRID